MCARAVLTCRPNSHPFQDRTLPLDQPIKIGRSVARARPSPNNAIFDCKVLSRNHALLWYETENGKFYLQDTKSSNGTFVNNQRLSKSSEESAPRELCSGDIVQFGVDVMEVNKKLTHGCIIANVQLFLPDGKEAKASSSTIVPEKATSTPVQDIYLLNQYLKEAMLREQVLENKLAIMTKHLTGTKEFMEQNWRALIEEDRLLTRVDILERQLQASHKSMSEDKLREEVTQLLQDKEKYQNVAKDALRKAMQEKLEISKRFKDAERNLQEMESHKVSLEEMCERNFKELKELAEKYEQAEQSKKEITEEMNLSTEKYKEELESLNLTIKEKEDTLKDKKSLIEELMSKMDSKLAENIPCAHNEDTGDLLPPKDAGDLVPSKDDIISVDSTESNDSEHKLQDLNDNKLKQENTTYNGLQTRMTELEEELAVYKDQYNECSSNCSNLSRKYTELSKEHQALLSQSKTMVELEEELAVYKDRYNECSSNCSNLSRKFAELSKEHQALDCQSKSMIELEEELAVYKDRYNECSSNCSNLSRKYTELSKEHQALLCQSKSVNLLVVIPVIIIVLAILIALRPSS